MTPEQFCYWLQGFFEMTGARQLDERQTEVLKKHLETVFTNVTGYGTFNDPVECAPEPEKRSVATTREELNDLLDPFPTYFPVSPGGQTFCSNEPVTGHDPNFEDNKWAVDTRIQTVKTC